MFDLLDGLVVFILFLLLLYLGWRSTEVRDYTYSHPPGAASTSGLLSSSGLHRSSLDSVPVRGNLLNRLVDQIQTSSELESKLWKIGHGLRAGQRASRSADDPSH